MFARTTALVDRRVRWRRAEGLPLALCLSLALLFGANDACAAALGSLATSVGLFAALAALFVVKGWPSQLPASALSTAGGALLVAGGAAWLLRAHWIGRWPRLGGVMKARVRAPASRAAGRMPSRAPVRLPSGVHRDMLLAELRLHFMRLHEAWDTGATTTLQTLTTPDMLDELRHGLPECAGSGSAGSSSRTEIVTLRADLFGYEELAGGSLASVEFSGLMRESSGQCAAPFRELWMLTKAKDGDPAWKLARHQALL